MDERLRVFYPQKPVQGTRVVYWMNASLRIEANLALAWAAREARRRSLPLEILVADQPEFPAQYLAQNLERHRAFRLEGLVDVVKKLRDRGLSVHVIAAGNRGGISEDSFASTLGRVLAGRNQAALAVTDFRALPGDRLRIRSFAEALACPLAVVEDNTSRPIAGVSPQAEWSAATLRPKLLKQVTAEVEAGFYPQTPWDEIPEGPGGSKDFADFLGEAGFLIRNWADLEIELESLPRFPGQRGGETAAQERLEHFLDHKIFQYNDLRNDPTQDGVSGLSPAFRYGFLSPLTLVSLLVGRKMWKTPLTYRSCGQDPVSKFIDEALVRRELSFNHAFYASGWGTWESLPAWARATLEKHQADPRPWTYPKSAWEAGKTHDRAWNAAQAQLQQEGIIHGMMRMYWGKKILEWSSTPREAYSTALELNNAWALDGGDPNSFAGVGWCFGLHDRPWGERPVYGLVRSMTEGGLRKKFDLEAYIRRYTPDPDFTLRP